MYDTNYEPETFIIRTRGRYYPNPRPLLHAYSIRVRRATLKHAAGLSMFLLLIASPTASPVPSRNR